jgi:hypothetical protein
MASHPQWSASSEGRALRQLQQGLVEVSIYPTSNGFDVIDSAFRRFTEPHDVGGRVHRDRLILDDEALFLQDEAGKKAAFCRPLHSTRELTSAGTWARRTQWRIPCPLR